LKAVDLMNITFTVNGEERTLEVPGSMTLLELLRERLGLTGAKEGCGVGDCGACTVIMDGREVNACLVLACQLPGRRVETVESLANGDELHPLQRAFIEQGAVQCGFCTPGILMAAKAMLDRNPRPSREEIKQGISGCLCRCTGYAKIFTAIEQAAAQMQNPDALPMPPETGTEQLAAVTGRGPDKPVMMSKAGKEG